MKQLIPILLLAASLSAFAKGPNPVPDALISGSSVVTGTLDMTRAQVLGIVQSINSGTSNISSSRVSGFFTPSLRYVTNRFLANHDGWHLGDPVLQSGDSLAETATLNLNDSTPQTWAGASTDPGDGTLPDNRIYAGTFHFYRPISEGGTYASVDVSGTGGMSDPDAAAVIARQVNAAVPWVSATSLNGCVYVTNNSVGAVPFDFIYFSTGDGSTTYFLTATFSVTQYGYTGVPPGQFIVSGTDLGNPDGYTIDLSTPYILASANTALTGTISGGTLNPTTLMQSGTSVGDLIASGRSSYATTSGSSVLADQAFFAGNYHYPAAGSHLGYVYDCTSAIKLNAAMADNLAGLASGTTGLVGHSNAGVIFKAYPNVSYLPSTSGTAAKFVMTGTTTNTGILTGGTLNAVMFASGTALGATGTAGSSNVLTITHGIITNIQ